MKININKLVSIIKNKALNYTLMAVYLVFILVVAYVDLNYPKEVSLKVSIPIFIASGTILFVYLVMFVLVRILSNKK